MNKSLSNLLTLFLACIGCVIALVLTIGEHASNSEIGCFKNGGGCASTTGSVYGHVGPLPTSIVGLLMYVAFVAFCLARGKQLRLAREREAARAAAYASSAALSFAEEGAESEKQPTMLSPETPDMLSDTGASGRISARALDGVLWGLALLGFGISVWLQYVAIYQLHSFCKYCMASAIVVTLIFALASRDYLLDGRKLTGEQKMIGGVLALIAVLGSFMLIPDIIATLSQSPGPVSVPDARGLLTASMLHSKGNPKAKYALIEFADYECGHCALASAEVEKMLKPHADDIRLVFRNYPLPIHKWAEPAAAAAEAAGEQGKFWEMHDLLFKHQKDLEAPFFADADFDKYAASLNLNIAKFDRDRMSEGIANRVRADFAAGSAGRVESTPTFIFIAPTHVTSFPGLAELDKFLKQPHNKDWE